MTPARDPFLFFNFSMKPMKNDKDLIFKCEFMNIMTMTNRNKDEINMKIAPKSKTNKAKQQRKHGIGAAAEGRRPLYVFQRPKIVQTGA